MTTAATERPTVATPDNVNLPAHAPSRGGPMEIAFDLKAIKARLGEIKAFLADPGIMVPEVDYGKIPGTDNIALKKSGAEKLAEFYGVIQRPRVVEKVETWDDPIFFHREYELDLVSRRDGYILGTGIGSCNSKESRYRWRNAERVCPECSVAAIIKGRPEFGGGWVCFKRKNGCGAKFEATDAAIVDQKVGRVENDDVPTLHNTIIKMAKKRALVDGIVSITRSAGLLVEVAEEDEEDHDTRADRKTDTGPRDAAGGNKEPTISDPQAAQLNDAAEKAGHDFEHVARWVKDTVDHDLTTGNLPKKHFVAVLKRLSDPTPLFEAADPFRGQS